MNTPASASPHPRQPKRVAYTIGRPKTGTSMGLIEHITKSQRSLRGGMKRSKHAGQHASARRDALRGLTASPKTSNTRNLQDHEEADLFRRWHLPSFEFLLPLRVPAVSGEPCTRLSNRGYVPYGKRDQFWRPVLQLLGVTCASAPLPVRFWYIAFIFFAVLSKLSDTKPKHQNYNEW